VGIGTSRAGRFQLLHSMADVWNATAGNERPFAGHDGPAARLSLMIAVENGWSGARNAYDYLWSFIGEPASRSKLSNLAQRPGWALDFDTGAAASIATLDPATGTIDPAATDPTAASSVSPTAQDPHAMMTAAIGTAVTSAIAPFTLPEGIPDFSQDTARPGVQSVQSGNWSNPATWQGGQVPTANHVVRILAGHTVTITDTSAVAYTVAIDGKLTFATTANTRLKATNIEVMAGNMGMGTPGVLEVGTTASPVAPGVTAEIVIANSPLGGSVSDPDQYGTGIIVLGKLSMHGSARTPTFVRLATEPRAGSTTLALSQRSAAGGRAIGSCCRTRATSREPR
jgi:G8 domain